MYLATHNSERVTAETIATAYEISFHHIAKAAQWLARSGYIHTDRGRGGGLTLQKASTEINIGRLLKASEAGTVLVDCMHADGGRCSIRPACGLKLALIEAQTAFYTTLEQYTLADITANHTALRALLTPFKAHSD